MQKKDPEHIRTILNRFLRDRDWEERLQASLTLSRWQEAVGPTIARQCQPEFLTKGVLQVRVENSVWLTHLRFLREELRHKLNHEFPSLDIREIRFRQGPLESLASPPSPTIDRSTRPRTAKDNPVPPLTPEQQSLLKRIPDRDLRRRLKSLLRKQQKHHRT
ncbi:MAG: DUF721 domain-containing protein [Deltaproteobacteria bacterium]|nr:MAG: DUF721 domain-containing protein [Deltaproteobacteria bacterium]